MELSDVTDSKSVGLITRVGSSPTTGTRTQWLANPVISRVCGLSFLPYALDFSPCASANSDCFWHGPPVLRQIWRSISVMDHRRIYPHNRVGRRHFGIEIQMSIDIRGRRNIAVAQPFLDFFQADSVCIQQTRAAMPLRYNYDKPEKPRRIKGFEVFSLVFSSFSKPKNHTEISRIIGGVSLTTNE